MTGARIASPWIRLGASVLEDVLFVVTLGVGWLVWAALVADKGQTPAKQLLHLRVIGKRSSRPVGILRMVLSRGILGFLVSTVTICLTGGIILLMPLWSRNRESIWDKATRTYVVDENPDGWR